MTDSERGEVWRIITAVSNFKARLNNRMECVIFPNEQKKLVDEIQDALEKNGFL